ncbi:MAG TPA: class I SAM-dependent methyltransferase [Anaerolineales bacterium]|nr:class I SAM-dependent methyltransferase [Anaerolineales bacterium]
MDRTSWLREKRHEAEEGYDILWSPLYDVDGGNYPNASHLQFIQKFVGLFPQKSILLDAACGTGRYMPLLLEKGHSIIGIDQAKGMLARANEKFPEVQFEKVGLQEMSFENVFDGAICMDAMEHVCPEDWRLVLANFQRALKQQGYLYFTVELADETEIKAAFEQAQLLGLPVVYGEWINDDVYHYYPALEQVREWVQQAGLTILEEGEGDGYHHFLMRKA